MRFDRIVSGPTLQTNCLQFQKSIPSFIVEKVNTYYGLGT